MRYDKKVWFCQEGEKVYDKTTGNYEIGEEHRICRYGSVVGAQIEAQNLKRTTIAVLFGSLIKEGKIVHIQQKVDGAFDYIRIGEPNTEEFKQKYEVDAYRVLRQKQIFVIREVKK